MKNIYVLTTLAMFAISATLAAIGVQPSKTHSQPIASINPVAADHK